MCSHDGTGHCGNHLYGYFFSKRAYMKLLKFFRKNQITYSITVNGDCMTPLIKNGDVVRIFPCDDYNVGDIVLCVDINKVRYVHRIHQIVGDRYITKADNNLCVDGCPISKANILGKVII